MEVGLERVGLGVGWMAADSEPKNGAEVGQGVCQGNRGGAPMIAPMKRAAPNSTVSATRGRRKRRHGRPPMSRAAPADVDGAAGAAPTVVGDGESGLPSSAASSPSPSLSLSDARPAPQVSSASPLLLPIGSQESGCGEGVLLSCRSTRCCRCLPPHHSSRSSLPRCSRYGHAAGVN